MHVMVDIETLGNDLRTGPIIAIGAVPFTMAQPLTRRPTLADRQFAMWEQAFYVPIRLKEQLELGMRIEHETLQWWLQTDAKLLYEFMTSQRAESLTAVFGKFKQWLDELCPEINDRWLWSHGVTYDCQHLAEKWPIVMGESFNRVCPFRQMRDTRTLFHLYEALTGIQPLTLIEREQRHHPLEDAWVQACAVQIAWKGLING